MVQSELKWPVDRKITLHIPVWDKSTRSEDTFSRADFLFDRDRNVYICPGGKLLRQVACASRRSSGSIRADRAVEPTRSANTTVT
jgi:hypothetical protein